MDRTFDLLSPLLHDYFYESSVYDSFEVGEEGELTLSGGAPKPKLIVLNDQDELWVSYRNRHIAEVNQTLNDEITNAVAENKRVMGGSRST